MSHDQARTNKQRLNLNTLDYQTYPYCICVLKGTIRVISSDPAWKDTLETLI